jgi:hypothetical protein
MVEKSTRPASTRGRVARIFGMGWFSGGNSRLANPEMATLFPVVPAKAGTTCGESHRCR